MPLLIMQCCLLLISYLHSRFDEVWNLLHHDVVEVWVEAVHWAIHRHSHTFFVDAVKEHSDTGGSQVCCSPGDTLTDVADVGTVTIGGIVES